MLSFGVTLAAAMLALPISAANSHDLVPDVQASLVTDGHRKIVAVSFLRESTHAAVVGYLTDCELLVDEPFGHANGHPFHAYGGLCSFRTGKSIVKWQVCSDDGVGNLAALTGRQTMKESADVLITFTRDNCVGG